MGLRGSLGWHVGNIVVTKLYLSNVIGSSYLDNYFCSKYDQNILQHVARHHRFIGVAPARLSPDRARVH